MPPNVIPVTVGNEDIVIAANDWNTISARSLVPRDIGLTLDADFNASPVTRNRFQYLADLLAAATGPDFTMYGVVSVPVDQEVITIVALVNPTSTARRLTRLTMRVVAPSPRSTLTKATFYSSKGQHLVIGPETVYFARLTSPLMPTASRSTNFIWHFNWDALDCESTAC